MYKKTLLGLAVVIIIIVIVGIFYFDNSNILQGNLHNTNSNLLIRNQEVTDTTIERNELNQPLNRIKIKNNSNEVIQIENITYNLDAGIAQRNISPGFYNNNGAPVMTNLRIETPNQTLATIQDLPSFTNEALRSEINLTFQLNSFELQPQEIIQIRLIADFTEAYNEATNPKPIKATLVPNELSIIPNSTRIVYTEPFSIAEITRNNCNQNSFNMAFLLVADDANNVSRDNLLLINNIIDSFGNAFSDATGGLAEMTTEGPFIIQRTPNMNNDDVFVISQAFYAQHPDDYNFLTIYTDYNTGGSNAFHQPVQNKINGLDLGIMDITADLGSEGRLLGINFMREIQTTAFNPTVYATNLLLHETAHQWGVYVGDNFQQGANNAELEISMQGIHFYRGLSSPDEASTALGADYWVANGDGTYRRESNPELGYKYHPFLLYFMGVLPEDEYDTEYTIYDAGGGDSPDP
ncbi:hypothetical protein KKC94_02820, partial [Patescibacteria group bacterium]|nr:hypothetical protein [Patescibacteria group bacterium]